MAYPQVAIDKHYVAESELLLSRTAGLSNLQLSSETLVREVTPQHLRIQST